MQVAEIDKHLEALDIGSENLSKFEDEPMLTEDGDEEMKSEPDIDTDGELEIKKIPVREKALVHDLV